MTELKPCPFCGDPMEWRKGDYAAHTDPSASCPLATQGFTIITAWNTRTDIANAAVVDLIAQNAELIKRIAELEADK
jgi:hypothetical protein